MLLRRFIGGFICSAMLCTAALAQEPDSNQNPNRQQSGVNQRVMKPAPDATRDSYLTESRAGASKELTSSQSGQPNINTISMVDSVQLQLEISQQCIADSKEYLSKKKGSDFDKCFIGMQMAKHAAMHSKLKVMQSHASDELKQMVADWIKITTSHMQAAERLMTSLENADDDKRTTKAGK